MYSPITYRGIEVGSVTAVEFSSDATAAHIHAFAEIPIPSGGERRLTDHPALLPDSRTPGLFDTPAESDRMPGEEPFPMSATGVGVFDMTIQKTNRWLDDLMDMLGSPRARSRT